MRCYHPRVLTHSISKTTSRAVRLGLVVGVAILGVARPASADCAPVRPATAEEKKAHADGFALFLKMAPPAPAGWELHDSAENGELKEVCAGPDFKVLDWSFSRGFTAPESVMQARQDEAVKQTETQGQKAQAQAKANEQRLAVIQQQQEALTKKMVALATATPPKVEEAQAINEQIAKLQEEEAKLRGFADSDAAMKTIDAQAKRDTGASFNLSTETDVRTDGWAPMSFAEGKAFRQDYNDDNGNPETQIMVILNPAAGPKALKTVVRISGDPARADALLKATKFRR